jgi:5-methylcytosine-specific restriction enzyme subunit McrC
MTKRILPLAPLREWQYLKIADQPVCDAVTEAEAEALLLAAASHPLAKDGGTNILARMPGRRLRAQQMVGVIAAAGVVLEILPKVDPDTKTNLLEGIDEAPSLRARLVAMLGVALQIDLGVGADVSISRQSATLLDVFIAQFADRLLAEARRGLPRNYLAQAEDLPQLRGRLDMVRQFTAHAARPYRLACRFDELTSDIALLQIIKSAVCFIDTLARHSETRRKLAELRLLLRDISDKPPSALPWTHVRIDRSNRRWDVLFRFASLFLRRGWQATHHDARAPEGIALLFPMNELFEAYIAAMLRRGLAGTGTEVVAQGGRRHCLGVWEEGARCVGSAFQTIPDIVLKQGGRTVAILDTKWKRLATKEPGAKKGVQQSDVYQMMAYARVYWPPIQENADPARLMLLYPSVPGEPDGLVHNFGIHGGHERLSLARINVGPFADASGHNAETRVAQVLAEMARELIAQPKSLETI